MNAPPLVPPPQDPALFYRSMAPQPDWLIYREGALIVFNKGVPFPGCCLKCGAPATHAVRTTLQWHNPWLYLLILPGLMVYAIVATAVSERAEVVLPLCAAHRARRLRWIAAAWAIGLASLGAPLALSAVPSLNDALGVALCALPIVGLLAACVVGIVGARLVAPTFIDARIVKAKGAGAAFLAKCPPIA